MTLTMVLGSSGAGKTQWLYQHMIEKAEKEKDSKILVIVPEQFTMQTQRDFVLMSEDHTILNIDVLSFVRMACRAASETGEEDVTILEDAGKMMLLRKIAEERKEELSIFSGQMKKPGFLDEVKSFLSEIYQYGITKGRWQEMMKQAQGKQALSAKLSDLYTVFTAFEEKLEGHYRVAEEMMTVLGRKISESAWIRDSILCLDGFTGFTPTQYAVLSELMKYCREMYLTVTVDVRRKDGSLSVPLRKMGEENLFFLSCDTIRKLLAIARENHVEVGDVIYPEAVYRDGKERVLRRFRESAVLAHLEKNLFRFPFSPYKEEVGDIKIVRTGMPKDEVSYVAAQMKHLIRTKGYRYREMAVVTGDMENYGSYIEEIFSRENIPVFLDQKAPFYQNPGVQFVLSWLNVMEEDFSYDALMKFLKNQNSFLTVDECDRLENYALAMGLRSFSQWEKEFTRNYRRGAKENLEEMNALREKILTHFQESHKRMKKAETVRDYAIVLHDFLIQEELFLKLSKQREAFEEEGEFLLAKEYGQVYEILLHIMDQMVELLSEEAVSLKEFREIFEEGLKKAGVGLIPPGLDVVVAGDIERTRLKDIRVLFFLGVNDGVIPKADPGGGILSELEREFLLEKDAPLAPSRRQRMFQEQFYLYLNLTKPRNALYVSFSQNDADGRKLSPSYLINKILRIFPKLSLESWEETDDALSLKKGEAYLMDGLRRFLTDFQGQKPDALWIKLYQEQSRNPEFRSFVEKIRQFYLWDGLSGISKEAARKLYGGELSSSITRLEKYAACAFSHYLMYGLSLNERETMEFTAPDLGSVFHSAMENFSNCAKETGKKWQELEEEKTEEMIRSSVRYALEQAHFSERKNGNRMAYMEKRITRMVRRTVWAVKEQLEKGEFTPVRFEAAFSFDAGMKLHGSIDRMDEAEDGEAAFFRIIDYKSGKTSFDLEKIYHGLSLQLVIYLEAAKDMYGKEKTKKLVVPAGIYYYGMDDPMLHMDGKDWTDEEVRKELLKKLKLSGLSNSEKKILALADSGLAGEPPVRSDVIPVELLKNGEFGARAEVADTIQFERLGRHVQKLAKQYGEEIKEGNAGIYPYRYKKDTGCDYCPYGEICGFDSHPVKKYRELAPFDDKKEIWKKIMEEDSVKEIQMEDAKRQIFQEKQTQAEEGRKGEKQDGRD